MNSLGTPPTLKIVIQPDEGSKLEALVKKITPSEDDHAYALVDDKGEMRPATAEIKEDRKIDILFFNAIWIEGVDVWTLDIITKEKKLRIGKLVSLG